MTGVDLVLARSIGASDRANGRPFDQERAHVAVPDADTDSFLAMFEQAAEAYEAGYDGEVSK